MRVRQRKRGFSSRHPIRVSEAYLRAVERLEALRDNCSGADKSWVEKAIGSFREHYAKAVRVR